MKIISLINSKGGVGKTTLAINLAAYLYNRIARDTDDRILLVDADPQGSIRDWHEASKKDTGFDVIAADRKSTLISLPNVLASGDYTYTIIDTPGKLSDITAAAITISDLCLIPICPSPYDLWATFDVVELLQTRHQLTEGRPDAAYVINRAVPATRISKSVAEYLETCAFPIIAEPIIQRVTYAESARIGCTIYDTSNASAIAEIDKLGESVIKGGDRMTFERKRKGDSSELAKLKKEIGTKKIKFTFLLDDEHRSKIKSIAAMKKTTVTDILCSYILEYIQKNGG